ncbi:hypothetical protein ABW19_dt0210338 [Dactylella cylindrospora]|nr:hypothetical protein ABW19_dt0210338 [Dactylella cylindrospora]
MSDFLRKGIGAIVEIAGSVVHTVADTVTGASDMHSPGVHDYQTGDYGNETHHPQHSGASTVWLGSARVLLILTVLSAAWLFVQLMPAFEIPGANALAIRRKDGEDTTDVAPNNNLVARLAPGSSEGNRSGGFTVYQINGNGSTEIAAQIEAVVSETTSSGQVDNSAQDQPTVYLASHDGTIHNHVNIIGTEPETTAFITDLVVQTDVVTVTITDEDLDSSSTDSAVALSTADSGTSSNFEVAAITHTGTWLHTH